MRSNLRKSNDPDRIVDPGVRSGGARMGRLRGWWMNLHRRWRQARCQTTIT